MLSRDYRDLVGGLVLTFVGLAFAWYAAENYDLGTVRRMGPGMFPTTLGLVLAVFGIAMAVPAAFRQGPMPEIRTVTPIFVLLGVVAFALTIRPFGLIPAILSVVVISSIAELKFRPVSLGVLCLVLCFMAWLIFRVALGLTIPMARWPF
jgi:hypothetical protein